MTKQLKQAYETPTTETLVVRFEGAILDGSIQSNGTQSGNVIDPNDVGFNSWN